MKTICGKRTARFMCTLEQGHAGPHGRAYRREPLERVMVTSDVARAQDYAAKLCADGYGTDVRATDRGFEVWCTRSRGAR